MLPGRHNSGVVLSVTGNVLLDIRFGELMEKTCGLSFEFTDTI
jgi:hypothetical protein